MKTWSKTSTLLDINNDILISRDFQKRKIRKCSQINRYDMVDINLRDKETRNGRS